MLREYRSTTVDIALLFAVPGILAAVHFFLSDSIQSQLVFTYGESSLVAAWTSAYLHRSNAHLYQNLFGYGIGAGFSYHLYVVYLQQRRRFWITVTTVLVVTPLITTVVDYIVLYRYAGLLTTGSTSQGFSGVSSAFGGMLLTTIGGFVADKYDAMTGAQTTLFIFLIAFGVLTIINGILTPAITGLLILGIGLLATQYVSYSDLRQPSRLRSRAAQHGANIVQTVLYGAVICVFIYLILPIEIVRSGSFVNVLAHSIGFLTGMITTGLIYGYQN